MTAYSPFWGGSLFCTKSNKDTLPEGLGGATVSSSLSPRFLLSRSSPPFDFASARKRSLSRWPSSRLTPSCFYMQNTTIKSSIIPKSTYKRCYCSFSRNLHHHQNRLPCMSLELTATVSDKRAALTQHYEMHSSFSFPRILTLRLLQA